MFIYEIISSLCYSIFESKFFLVVDIILEKDMENKKLINRSGFYGRFI